MDNVEDEEIRFITDGAVLNIQSEKYFKDI